MCIRDRCNVFNTYILACSTMSSLDSPQKEHAACTATGGESKGNLNIFGIFEVACLTGLLELYPIW